MAVFVVSITAAARLGSRVCHQLPGNGDVVGLIRGLELDFDPLLRPAGAGGPRGDRSFGNSTAVVHQPHLLLPILVLLFSLLLLGTTQLLVRLLLLLLWLLRLLHRDVLLLLVAAPPLIEVSKSKCSA